MIKEAKVLGGVLAKKVVHNVIDKMKDRLGVNDERYKLIIQIKEDYLHNRISLEEGRKILKEKIGTCTPAEFAYGEQQLKDHYDDEEITERMDDILELFEGILIRPENQFPANHPLASYLKEIAAMEEECQKLEHLMTKDFDRDAYATIIEGMRKWNTHLSRKQNQLYPMLETYGFDRPTKIMWTFDDRVRDSIRNSQQLLEEGKEEEFLKALPNMIYLIRDLNGKEEEVLVPTSAKLLTDKDYVEMSKGDHEIGYVYIDAPGEYLGDGSEEEAKDAASSVRPVSGGVAADGATPSAGAALSPKAQAARAASDKMQERLGVDEDRYKLIIQIKEDYLHGRMSLEEGRKILKEKIGSCTAVEFAYGEQKLKEKYDDEEITERMDDILELFDGILVRPENQFPANHPLGSYLKEIRAMEGECKKLEELADKKFIKNQYMPIMEGIRKWPTHLSRKQNQLYPMLESYGFDRPTKIMWTFDDKVRDAIRETYQLLVDDKDQEFLAAVPNMIYLIRDLCGKEEEVLIPTSSKLLTDQDFVTMSKSDHEIGYVFIDAPELYHGVDGTLTADGPDAGEEQIIPAQGGGNAFMKDLADLLGKYQIPLAQDTNRELTPEEKALEAKTKVLDVATGKLTLEQINLLFKHMPVDLSFVDESELVAFYSDTKHRIFPRSANVIGREVRNCHPRTSVHVVEEIIQKFRSGEEDQVDFWINKPGAFIYVLYTAIRDEEGNFRGIMEMMQDCTRIRELEGSRTLLTWEK